jgi:hypothetical protein
MNITLKLKKKRTENDVSCGSHLAGMNRSDISEECTVQLYWVTEYFVGG